MSKEVKKEMQRAIIALLKAVAGIIDAHHTKYFDDDTAKLMNAITEYIEKKK